MLFLRRGVPRVGSKAPIFLRSDRNFSDAALTKPFRRSHLYHHCHLSRLSISLHRHNESSDNVELTHPCAEVEGLLPTDKKLYAGVTDASVDLYRLKRRLFFGHSCIRLDVIRRMVPSLEIPDANVVLDMYMY